MGIKATVLYHHPLGGTVNLASWIAEGIRHGKVPWCCDGWIEGATSDALERRGYHLEQATMEETLAWREGDD